MLKQRAPSFKTICSFHIDRLETITTFTFELSVKQGYYLQQCTQNSTLSHFRFALGATVLNYFKNGIGEHKQ